MTEQASIHLIWLHNRQSPPNWPLGDVYTVQPTPVGVTAAVDELLVNSRDTDYCLFWEATLGVPDQVITQRTVKLPGDCWHAGLKLGTQGFPGLIDFVDPVWPLNRDPDKEIVATSWRMSLMACLVKVEVLEKLGGPDARFETLTACSLECGHRWLRNGVLMRHVPDLVNAEAVVEPSSLVDEFLFVRLRYGRMWHRWAFFRSVVTQHNFKNRYMAFNKTRTQEPWQRISNLHQLDGTEHVQPATVSVLIPTLDRYPHLFNLLEQVGKQTVSPLEIIVIDQTSHDNRKFDWPDRFPDLPLNVIWLDQAGQCSSRNTGLANANGDYILFLDDDDEIPSDLIATHLQFINEFQADASCGIAEEVGAGALPQEFRFIRNSDGFPTNNTMLRRVALADSGLFDLAYERGERADGDLGMRLYLSGKYNLLNPDASVLHLHAPRGGLRQHKARMITRGGSRVSIRQRQLLAATEAYLWLRYFSERQVNEALLIRTLATLRGAGKRWQKIARFVLMFLYLPITWQQNRKRLQVGKILKETYPKIPELNLAEEVL